MRCQHRFRVQRPPPLPSPRFDGLAAQPFSVCSFRSPPSLASPETELESGGTVGEEFGGFGGETRARESPQTFKGWKAPSTGCRIQRVASCTGCARVCVYAAPVLHLHMQNHHHSTWGFRRRCSMGRREKGLIKMNSLTRSSERVAVALPSGPRHPLEPLPPLCLGPLLGVQSAQKWAHASWDGSA